MNNNCSKCKCITCEKIDTCIYHRMCTDKSGKTQYIVKNCKYYIVKKNDGYSNETQYKNERRI